MDIESAVDVWDQAGGRSDNHDDDRGESLHSPEYDGGGTDAEGGGIRRSVVSGWLTD